MRPAAQIAPQLDARIAVLQRELDNQVLRARTEHHVRKVTRRLAERRDCDRRERRLIANFERRAAGGGRGTFAGARENEYHRSAVHVSRSDRCAAWDRVARDTDSLERGKRVLSGIETAASDEVALPIPRIDGAHHTFEAWSELGYLSARDIDGEPAHVGRRCARVRTLHDRSP